MKIVTRALLLLVLACFIYFTIVYFKVGSVPYYGGETVEEIAYSIQETPYSLFTSNCIIRSLRFRNGCESISTPAKVAVGFCSVRLRSGLVLLAIHAWGEVNSERIEVSRLPGENGVFGVPPIEYKPVVAVRF